MAVAIVGGAGEAAATPAVAGLAGGADPQAAVAMNTAARAASALAITEK
jgi:hypothetical protein